VTGLPVLQIRSTGTDRPVRINVADVQELIQTAIRGTEATQVLEGLCDRSGVRFPPKSPGRQAIGNLLVSPRAGKECLSAR